MTEDHDETEQASSQADESRPVVLRDEKGRVLPGSRSLNPRGRPRGTKRVVITDAAERLSEAKGMSMSDALQSVLEATFKSALAGDVSAQKLLIEKLGMDDQQAAAQAAYENEDGSVGPQMPKGQHLVDYLMGCASAHAEVAARYEKELVDAGEVGFHSAHVAAFRSMALRYAGALAVDEVAREKAKRDAASDGEPNEATDAEADDMNQD